MDYFDCVFWGGKRSRQKQQVGRVPDTSVPSPPLKTVCDRVIECVSLICSLFRYGFAHGTIIFDIVHDSWAGKALLHQEMAALRQRRSDLKRQVQDAAKEERNLAKKRQRLMQAGDPSTKDKLSLSVANDCGRPPKICRLVTCSSCCAVPTSKALIDG